MFFYPGGKIPFKLTAQLIPAAIIFVYETWFYFIDTGENKTVIRNVFSDPASQPVTLLVIAGVLVLLFQYALLLRLELGFIKSRKHGNLFIFPA